VTTHPRGQVAATQKFCSACCGVSLALGLCCCSCRLLEETPEGGFTLRKVQDKVKEVQELNATRTILETKLEAAQRERNVERKELEDIRKALEATLKELAERDQPAGHLDDGRQSLAPFVDVQPPPHRAMRPRPLSRIDEEPGQGHSDMRLRGGAETTSSSNCCSCCKLTSRYYSSAFDLGAVL
jgi:hypothetical protein